VTLNLVPRVSRLLFLWGGKIRDPGDQVECPQMFLPALNGIQISRVLIFTLDFFSLITKNFKKIKNAIYRLQISALVSETFTFEK